jgi:hypothetical protein
LQGKEKLKKQQEAFMSTPPISSTGNNPLRASDPNASSQTYAQRAKNSFVNVTSSISQCGPVNKVRNSTVWSYVTWPFSALWARISKIIWGSPSVAKDMVKLTESGWIFGETTYDMPTEVALRSGKLTFAKGIEDKVFTEESAKENGWILVQIPGKAWGNWTMLLKDAIQGGYMTRDKAISDGHITQEQADKATWLPKETV